MGPVSTVLMLLLVSSAQADPSAVGKRVGGGATGEVFDLTVGGKTGVVKVPVLEGEPAQETIRRQLVDYKVAERDYQGAKIYSDRLVEVRLPDGRITRGIFMEKVKGLRLDAAVGLFNVANSPRDGREAIVTTAGFPVTGDHFKALQKIEEKLRANGQMLLDFNAENILLVAPEQGYLRIIDPTIEETAPGANGERELKKSLEYVRFELNLIAGPTSLSLSWTCPERLAALAEKAR